MWGAIGGALIGAVAGSKSQSKANKANATATRETNETNTRINDANNAANLQRVRETNALNERLAAEANYTNLHSVDKVNDLNRDINTQQIQLTRDLDAAGKAHDFAVQDKTNDWNLGMYKMQRADELDDIGKSFLRVREAAEAGGFNALTALQGGGATPSAVINGAIPVSSGSPGAPSLIPMQAGQVSPAQMMAHQGSAVMHAAPQVAAGFDVGPMIEGVGKAYDTERKRLAAEAEAKAEQQKVNSGVTHKDAKGGTVITPKVRTKPFSREEMDALREDVVPMYDPTFNAIMIPRAWVNEVGKQPGAMWVSEDMEKLGGEIASEVIGAINGPAAVSIYYGDGDSWDLGDAVRSVTNFVTGGPRKTSPQPKIGNNGDPARTRRPQKVEREPSFTYDRRSRRPQPVN